MTIQHAHSCTIQSMMAIEQSREKEHIRTDKYDGVTAIRYKHNHHVHPKHQQHQILVQHLVHDQHSMVDH
jgi:hypothetical protein